MTRHILFVLIAVFITACEKPDFAEPIDQGSEEFNTETSSSSKRTVSPKEIPHIIGHLRKHIEIVRTRSGPGHLSPDSIKFDEIVELALQDSVISRVYTFNVASSDSLSFFNVIIEEFQNGDIMSPFVLGFHMDSVYAHDYYNAGAPLTDFLGRIAKYQFHTVFGNSHSANRNLWFLEFCWEFIFGVDPNHPTARPTATVGNLPTGFTAIPTPNGITVGSPLPESGCVIMNVRIGEVTGNIYVEFLPDNDCNGEVDPSGGQTVSDRNRDYIPADSRDPDEECLRLLIEAGMIPPINPPTPPGSTTNLWDKLAEDLGVNSSVKACMTDDNNKDTMLEVVRIRRSGLIDLCNGERSVDDILNDALTVSCATSGSSGIDVAALYDAIGIQSTYLNFISQFDIPNNAEWIQNWVQSNSLPCCGTNFEACFSAAWDTQFPGISYAYVSSVMGIAGTTFERIANSYDDWENLSSPEDIDPPAEINNKIDIGLNYVSAVAPPTGTPFAHVPPRETVNEDLWSRVNGNDSGILLSDNLPDSWYFADMGLLFDAVSIFDINMEHIGDDFIDRFQSNLGTDYLHTGLNEAIRTHPTFRNFLKLFGADLEQEIQNAGGNLSNIAPFILPQQIRPVFNTRYDRWHGFQILTNDVEEVKIHKLELNFDPATGDWDGAFYVEYIDHFGLDTQDAIAYQSWHSGFASWWRLQHRRGYQAFKTRVHVVAHLSGNVND